MQQVQDQDEVMSEMDAQCLPRTWLGAASKIDPVMPTAASTRTLGPRPTTGALLHSVYILSFQNLISG